MTPDAAEILALQALGFVAADDDALNGLQANTGIDQQTLRTRATELEILAGVLDYLLSDEAQLLVFCESVGIDPRLPARARYVITGEEPYE
jgi:hypothetical protein